MLYKQRVGTEDVFMNMTLKDASTEQ